MQYESEGIIRRQIIKLLTALSNYNELRYVILYPSNRNNLVFTVYYIMLMYKMKAILNTILVLW